jgi:hypothetical protein
MGVDPDVLANATNRRLNIKPLKATGVNANHAILNWRRVVGVNGPEPGFKLEKRPQLVKKPVAILELREVTELIQRSLVVS